MSSAAVPMARAGGRWRGLACGLAATWPAWALGLLVGVGYFLSSPVDSDFWWFDASRHAMNSVFVHDFFAQGGWRAPIQFARAYYDQYPGINIGFYPPFLYMVTAPVLGVFGVSHAVCQAVVSGFAGLAAMAGYAWTRASLGRFGAVAAGLMVVLAPEMVLWGRQVQLDVPAVTLLLWGAWALTRYLEADGEGTPPTRARWLVLAALLLGAAMLTRVQTIFVWPLWLAIVFIHPAARARPWSERLWTTGLYAVLSLPSIASAIYFAKVVGSLAGQMPDMPALLSWANWGWYAARFPEQLGMAGVAALLLGLLALLARRPGAWPEALRGRAGVLLMVALLGWTFFTLVSNKEQRFDLAVLPFVLLAAALTVSRWPVAGKGAVVLVPVLAVGMLLEAVAADHWADEPRVTGHRQAALLAAELAPQGSRVMISAHRDGNFIFALRADGHRPDLAVRRADKLLVEMAIMRQLGIRDRGMQQDDVRALLEREQISVVVAQTGYLGDQPSMQALEQLLASGCCFELRARVPIEGRHRADERELLVYLRR